MDLFLNLIRGFSMALADSVPGVSDKQEGQSLAQYLEDHVFAGNEGTTIAPDPEIVQGFEQFMESYRGGLQIEETSLHW